MYSDRLLQTLILRAMPVNVHRVLFRRPVAGSEWELTQDRWVSETNVKALILEERSGIGAGCSVRKGRGVGTVALTGKMLYRVHNQIASTPYTTG